MRVIPSNLHSCHGVIQDFRRGIPNDLAIPFADIVFPEERLPCIIGREVRFLLAVDEDGGAGCCMLALSTEPLRTEMLFIHSIRNEGAVIRALLDDVLAVLKSKRAPDLEVKYVEGMHSISTREALNERGFTRATRGRMLLESSQSQVASMPEQEHRVRATDSLLDWRALYLSATTSQSLEDCRRQVRSETPHGTIQEDDLRRLLAYRGNTPVGTIGYSVCRNVGYLDKLSIMPNVRNRLDAAKALLVKASRLVTKKKCSHIVIDIQEDLVPRETLAELGFRFLGKVSYFDKVITLRTSSRTTAGSGGCN